MLPGAPVPDCCSPDVKKPLKPKEKNSIFKKEKIIMLSKLVAFLLLVCFVTISGANKALMTCRGSEDYPYHIYLDPDGEILLSWKLDYKCEQIEFYLCADLATTAPSLLTFGFSERGTLTDADLIAIYWSHDHLSETRQIFVKDSYTNSNGTLMLDPRQDISVVGLPQYEINSGQVRIKIKRSFDTCDSRDYPIDRGTTHLVWSYSPHLLAVYETLTPFGLDISNDGMPVSKQGFQRAQLLKPQIKVPELPEDSRKLLLTVNNIKVPSDETTYWCHVLKLPSDLLEHKRHIVQFGGHITKGNEALVHHMELFHCVVPSGTRVPFYSGSCQSAKKPAILENCAKVMAAWAMGAPPLVFPEEAGQPIGHVEGEPPFSQWVMLEVHYNNPEMKQGVIDSSGVELVITDKLRRYDAGTIETGLIYTPRMALPPNMAIFRLEGFCTSECTHEAIPEEGIKFFASQLHTHLTGQRAYTKHIREGVELAEINRDNHYSPHFQEIRMLPEEIVFLPGDEMITVCEDTTVDREKVTLGGFAISDEMCVNYLHYYPKIDFEVCKSSIDPETLDDFFRSIGVESKITGGTPLETPGDIEFNYRSVNWTIENRHKLQRKFFNQI